MWYLKCAIVSVFIQALSALEYTLVVHCPEEEGATRGKLATQPYWLRLQPASLSNLYHDRWTFITTTYLLHPFHSGVLF